MRRGDGRGTRSWTGLKRVMNLFLKQGRGEAVQPFLLSTLLQYRRPGMVSCLVTSAGKAGLRHFTDRYPGVEILCSYE